MAKIMTMNRRDNSIEKEKLPDGGWQYTVTGKNGRELLRITFTKPERGEDRLLNSDLLDIVRDRLEALNRSNRATFRSFNCMQHVYEALLWADVPAFRESKPIDDTEKDGD